MKEVKQLNFEIMESNLAEAIEQLQKLRTEAANETLTAVDFQIGLLHAYHHINWSWNTRHVETSKYANRTRKHFKKWGKYPSKIEDL